jgi:hypothetical protein
MKKMNIGSKLAEYSTIKGKGKPAKGKGKKCKCGKPYSECKKCS